MIIPPDVKETLDLQASLINSKDFIADDPVQFPRRFSRLQDIEITALLASMIAWGKRSMICRDMERILDIMEHEPYDFVMEKGYEAIDPDRNLHRTFFGRHMRYVLRGMHDIYLRHHSLDAFTQSLGIGNDDAPVWFLAGALNKSWLDSASSHLDSNPSFLNEHRLCMAEAHRCLPANMATTALKKLNMALRWLVRDDGIVDMGVWKSIPKSRLFIPLDVHVGNVSRQLGILTRRSNDRRAVEELTAVCRSMRPDDPAIYDYALFGIGVTSNQKNL